MQYGSYYESGRIPFLPDPSRGYWSHPKDFIYVSLGLAFKLDVFFEPFVFLMKMGVFSFFPYLICAVIYIVPLMVVQSFMGQFSSSGFISSFRVSPIFKGIGFVSLIINYFILLYSIMFASVPFMFFLYSFYPTLPWSCEYFAQSKLTNSSAADIQEICNHSNHKYTPDFFLMDHFTSFEYSNELSFSGKLFAVTILTWLIIGQIFQHCQTTERLGIVLRYMIWGTCGVMLIILIRFLFLPNALEAFNGFTDFHLGRELLIIPLTFKFGMNALGPGWGSMLTLASFNRFNENIPRNNWIICIGQMFIFLAMTLIVLIIIHNLKSTMFLGFIFGYQRILFLSPGSVIEKMGFPNFWSLLYFGMIFTATLVLMITQLHILVISLLDEFPSLRQTKMSVVNTMIGTLALFSTYLCTNHGIILFTYLSTDTIFVQTSLNLLLVFAVLWNYGRRRMLQDLEFMLGYPFPLKKVPILHYVIPFILVISFLAPTYFLYFTMDAFDLPIFPLSSIFYVALPWIFTALYAWCRVIITPGNLRERFSIASRPIDWYPVDINERERYAEHLGNLDMTYQLNEVPSAPVEL